MDKAKGFTLIELLIVIVIIGILAVIAIPKFGATREQAFITTMKTDLRNLQSAQEVYFTSGGPPYAYASDLADLDFTPSVGVTVDGPVVTADNGGWSAEVTHVDAAISCAVFVGNAPPVAPATARGRVECSDGS